MADDVVTRVQIAVNEPNIEELSKLSQGLLQISKDIRNVETFASPQSIIVESSLQTGEILKLVESFGRKAVVTGIGELGNAVAIIGESVSTGIKGVVRLTQVSAQRCVVDGTVDGFSPNQLVQLSINQYGDLSAGCDTCGDVLANPLRINDKSNYGALGDVTTDAHGRCSFRIVDDHIQTKDIIGRSIVLSQSQHLAVPKKLACGIIARSAGIFINEKRICTCDGKTIWDGSNSSSEDSSEKVANNSNL